MMEQGLNQLGHEEMESLKSNFNGGHTISGIEY